MFVDSFSVKDFIKLHSQHRLSSQTMNSQSKLEIYLKCVTCNKYIKTDEVLYNEDDRCL